MSGTESTEFRELIKKEFTHLDSTYFNTAYFGPSPYSAKQKVSRALSKELDPSFYDYSTWMGIPERERILLGKLIGCPADNITHSTSSSDINNTVALGYNFKPGDRIAAINLDYPSNVLPWMRCAERTNASFDLLDLEGQELPTVEWLEKKLHPHTKIFSVSYVTFDTGKKVDILSIGKLCQERGILFIVDATQALGGMPITAEQLKYIDILACSSYKWILGPYGHAFGYFSNRALELIENSNANWIISPNSKEVYSLLDYTTETLPGARRFDRGQCANMLTNSCLEASLELLLELGLENIEDHNKKLTQHFIENFPKNKYQLITPTDSMGNIVALKSTSVDSRELETELKFRNIDVSVRQGNIRLSFHLFNTEKQVNELIQALDL
jgi:selenocysteine lyase/cysteine desulfurase